MPKRQRINFFLTVLLTVYCCQAVVAEEPPRLFRELQRLPAAEAKQGVAVGNKHFYAITNRAIGKYNKQTGERIAGWQASDDSPFRHLNSGVIVGGKLYAAHSTWPANPRENSVEVWDTEALKHIDRHVFSDIEGAITWVDRHLGHWWVVFAHYKKIANIKRTTLVKLDEKWQPLESWRFPDSVIQRFTPYSNSGGSWGPDGLLYVTGHDRPEIYALRVPQSENGLAGSTLELVDTLPANIAGQGTAWDRTDLGIIYGIQRQSREVVKLRISHADEFAPLKKVVKWRRDVRNPILPPRADGEFDSARCMNPWVVRSGEQYQLYYSGGDRQGRQLMGLATTALNDLGSWQRIGPLFETGMEGAFDARWCVLPHVIKFPDNRWHMYYTGNAGRGTGLSAFPGIGLATSTDGQNWTRSTHSPVLERSGQHGDPDAIGIAGGSVIKVTNSAGQSEWRYYYTGCPTIGKSLPLNQQKVICLAVSDDGIEWKKRGPVMYRLTERDYENIAVAGPVVLQAEDGRFRMWYSAIGTRWGYYSICYAESDDGIHWCRGPHVDDNLQLTPTDAGWESQMVEYPSIIREGDHLRMFYCGNGYGKTGIGMAVGVVDKE